MPQVWYENHRFTHQNQGLLQMGDDEMSRADFLNKERWDAQRNTTVSSKLDRIIALLEVLLEALDLEVEDQ